MRASVIPQGHRPAKPTTLHKLHGTTNKTHHIKERRYEPTGGGKIGEAPDYMTDDQKAEWAWVLRTSPIDLYHDADFRLVCNFVEASIRHKDCMVFFNEYNRNGFGKEYPYLILNGKGELGEHPMLKVLDKASGTMRMCGAELGLSPASRPRLMTFEGRDKPKNEFERLRQSREKTKAAA